MSISNVFEKLGRAVFESPFGANSLSKDAPELAEVRLVVLDAIKAKSHRIAGKNVFPYDMVRIELLGIPEEQAPALRGDFLAQYLADELKTGLARSSYRYPENLTIEIATSSKLPQPGEQWLTVHTETRHVDAAPPQAGAAARLTVIQGDADPAELVLNKPRINIGRTAEVFRTAGPSRRNDLAFIGEGAYSGSVSREHAHILASGKTGDYRLFNDRTYKGDNNCGLWIVRDGLSQPVHRSARGTLLKPGDEIHLGRAIIRFS